MGAKRPANPGIIIYAEHNDNSDNEDTTQS